MVRMHVVYRVGVKESIEIPFTSEEEMMADKSDIASQNVIPILTTEILQKLLIDKNVIQESDIKAAAVQLSGMQEKGR